MSLVAGTRVGPYEIQSLIGQGGPPPRRTNLAALRRGLAGAKLERAR
jgi:hypothetical protein